MTTSTSEGGIASPKDKFENDQRRRQTQKQKKKMAMQKRVDECRWPHTCFEATINIDACRWPKRGSKKSQLFKRAALLNKDVNCGGMLAVEVTESKVEC
jgi:hypothetical protein